MWKWLLCAATLNACSSHTDSVTSLDASTSADRGSALDVSGLDVPSFDVPASDGAPRPDASPTLDRPASMDLGGGDAVTPLMDIGIGPDASSEADAGPGATLLAGLGGPNGFGPLVNCLQPADDIGWRAPGMPDNDSLIDFGSGFGFGPRMGDYDYNQFFVDNNGILVFGRGLSGFFGTTFGTTRHSAYIAPWWGNVDTSGGGQPARNHVCFVSEPSRVVVTWYEVGYFDQHDDLRNSFQAILTPAASGVAGDIDVEFRYARCQWTTGDNVGAPEFARPAQAGLDFGDRVNFVTLPGSQTTDVIRLCSTSNVGIPGVWRLQIRAGAPRLPL